MSYCRRGSSHIPFWSSLKLKKEICSPAPQPETPKGTAKCRPSGLKKRVTVRKQKDKTFLLYCLRRNRYLSETSLSEMVRNGAHTFSYLPVYWKMRFYGEPLPLMLPGHQGFSRSGWNVAAQ